MSLVGQHSGIIWHMGQKLDVALAEVNLGRLEIRLMPLELPKGMGSRGARNARGKGVRGKGSAAGRAAGGRKGSSSGWKLVSPGDGDGPGKKGTSGKSARKGKKNGAGKPVQPGRPSARKGNGQGGKGGKNGTAAPAKSGRPGKKSAGKRG